MYFRDLNIFFPSNKHIHREAEATEGSGDAGRPKAWAKESRDHGLVGWRDKTILMGFTKQSAGNSVRGYRGDCLHWCIIHCGLQNSQYLHVASFFNIAECSSAWLYYYKWESSMSVWIICYLFMLFEAQDASGSLISFVNTGRHFQHYLDNRQGILHPKAF